MVDDCMDKNIDKKESKKEKLSKVNKKEVTNEKEINNEDIKEVKEELENVNTNLSNNKQKNIFSTSEVVFFVILSLLIGLMIGNLLNKTKSIVGKNTDDEYLNEFIENYNYIINNYYEEVDKKKLVDSAINGMMESLDLHSVYFNQEETNNFSISLEGSYSGLGVQISKDSESGNMIVVSVFKNSPASEAGLVPGDYIVSINDKSATDMSASDFSSYVKNNKSNSFDLKIIRDGNEKTLHINKNTVTLSSVTSKIYENNNKKVGYLYIGIFANNTYEQFKEELNKLEQEKIDSLIIDVRGDTGGHLTAVDDILDLFLNSKHVMYQFEQNKKITKIYGKGKETKPYDIVLLGDEVSASASEVLIAGLKENLNAVLIGKKTYGKGTVQDLVTLKDGTQYKLTVKKWLTPKGNWVNDTEGIVPDIEVDLSEKYYTTYNEEDDDQLQSALNYIYNK